MMSWKGDPNAIHTVVDGEIAGLTEKATPVDADLVVIEDSADSNSKKKAQLGNLPGGSGTSDHGGLTGLTDDDHPQYLLGTLGGKGTVNVVAASGSTETLDLADGNDHDVTLTDNCTLTLTGSTNGVACYMTILLRQDGTGSRTVTWPASVEWVGGSAPTLQTAADAWDLVALVTYDGGTTWFAQHAGTGSGSATRDGWTLVESASQSDFDDTTDAGAILAVYRWGVDASGDPYFDSTGVTAGEEAALWLTDSDDYALVELDL